MMVIDGEHLSISDVANVSRKGEMVGLSPQARVRIDQAHKWVEAIVTSGKPVYGVNTGYGDFSDKKIPAKDLATLNRNLILSHAVGVGLPLPMDVVRAAMLIRANTLAKGYSGVRVEVVEALLAMLNQAVTPVITSQGSLGSSGDLGPLSTLALVFTTDANDRDEDSGYAQYQGKVMTGKAAMAAAGLKRIILGPKEGLALNNGATFSAAIAALVVHDATNLLNVGEISLAMTLEAMLGCREAFDMRLQQARGHPGQIRVAERVRELTTGSTLLDSSGQVQDAYSLRCAPQIQGAVRDTLDYVGTIVERELNAATDNPLLFEHGKAISGGNFHGEPVGLAMDFAGIALAELAAISERRTFRLTSECLNAGLPAMLVDRPEAAGLNSGVMMPQYTAASLVLENQTLAHPDSVHSLPTSNDQEDVNANSMTAARHAWEIAANTTHVLAIEVFTATRALDLRLKENPGCKFGGGVAAAHQRVREETPYTPGDVWWKPEIDRIHHLVSNGELAAFVQGNQKNTR